MNARLKLMVAFLIPAVASAYMTWLTWRADDEGKWLFTVFFGFFLLLVTSPFLPKLRTKPKPEPVSTSTRFVPHWFMLLAALVLLGAIILAVVEVIGTILRD